MTGRPDKKPRPPLDRDALERLALFYVGRYATTRAKFRSYLTRKVRERGWEGPAPDIAALAERLAELGYIDDAAFASARTASLQRRGYGQRRIAEALRAVGIEEQDALSAAEGALANELGAAMRFAQRKRIGPFAPGEVDRAGRQKAFAALMRAGHSVEVARQVLNASPSDIPDSHSGWPD